MGDVESGVVWDMGSRGERCFFFFFFKQKTAYEIVSRDWSSDVCSSDLAVDIAIAATAKLLTETVDSTRDQAMVDQAIKNLDRKSVV